MDTFVDAGFCGDVFFPNDDCDGPADSMKSTAAPGCKRPIRA